MQDEQLSGLTLDEKLRKVRGEFLDYIDKNIKEISATLPVFFAHIITMLNDSFPGLKDEVHDEFIDAITYRVLAASRQGGNLPFVEKVSANAVRAKRGPRAKQGTDIIAGMELIKSENYAPAARLLKEYSHLDAIIGAAVAYCYYMLSMREIASLREKGTRIDEKERRPNEFELLAREEMLRLANSRPPLGAVRELRIRGEEEPIIRRAFWLMISCSFEWFPNEKGFILVGLEKAKRDRNWEMKNELLKIATERFFDDFFFMKEMYHFRLGAKDGTGAAAVVRQMMQQFPDGLEPLYFGLQISMLSLKKTTYDGFRKLLLMKGIPEHIPALVDVAYQVMDGDPRQGLASLKELAGKFPRFDFYFLSLEYLLKETSSEDPKRNRRARKVFLDSIDRFCMKELGIER
ncbi:MAG TPA: hypothetical protein VKO45_01895 [Methanomicrobiales archaeon]|nr:hypothetical protein [Methanomicrobiales archaeon]